MAHSSLVCVNIQICFTPCLRIISWNISPPFIPTKLWSISGCRNGCRGCTSLKRSSVRLKAGLGVGRCCDATAAACADRVAVSDTFRFDVDFGCDCAPLLYGEMAAGAGVEENRRALGRHWTTRLAVLACNMLAVFIRAGKRRCREWRVSVVESGKEIESRQWISKSRKAAGASCPIFAPRARHRGTCMRCSMSSRG